VKQELAIARIRRRNPLKKQYGSISLANGTKEKIAGVFN
jgi:hypothetical protein